MQQDPWLTLEATLNQLLPESATGPSANDINAMAYLYQVMTVQPTEQDEKDFIIKGVSWLNAYAQSEKSSNFVNLPFIDKEQLLKGISQSMAGQNWLNTLLSYIFQAMLAPPSYGGNPSGIGWQWLAHQPGFPLPKEGQRYFELPNRARINFISQVKQSNQANNERKAIHQETRKA
jgi:gluconate 2-dehydrogenase gamma chain